MGTVQVDLKKELGELFDEAWRALDEGFYDPKMHKVDWKAMKTKYRDMAIDAENKDEFHNVVRQMLAELDASHLGISGGPSGGRGVAPAVEQTGVLGIEFEDRYKKFRLWQDPERVLAESTPCQTVNHVDPARARELVEKTFGQIPVVPGGGAAAAS